MDKFRPKGSLCMNCLHASVRNCSMLAFEGMQPIGKDDDGTIVVKCSEYTKWSKINDPKRAYDAGG